MLALVCTGAAQTAGSLGIFEGASDVGTPSHKGSVVYDAERKEYRVTGALGQPFRYWNRDIFWIDAYAIAIS